MDKSKKNYILKRTKTNFLFREVGVTKNKANMEAVAKHDFNATADDELSFRKGAVLKVTRLHTVWKFHDFSITQNLREINFWGF